MIQEKAFKEDERLSVSKQEWIFNDRSELKRTPQIEGMNLPWESEPDKIVWKDPVSGFDCMLHRNHVGAWCGYVGVPHTHALFGVHYGEAENWSQPIAEHGGLTFAKGCGGMDEDGRGICHPTDEGDDDHVWWFGFDCGHSCDSTPWEIRRGQGSVKYYRDRAYVTREVIKMADQLTLRAEVPA